MEKDLQKEIHYLTSKSVKMKHILSITFQVSFRLIKSLPLLQNQSQIIDCLGPLDTTSIQV